MWVLCFICEDLVLEVSDEQADLIRKKFPPISCRVSLFWSVTDWTHGVVMQTLDLIKGRCEGKAGLTLSSVVSSFELSIMRIDLLF